MTREEAREKILGQAKEHFKSDKSGKGYICPICGSGSGDKGTGLTENPKSPGHFTCWTGCFTNADIFEIIGQQFNIPDYNGQFEKCCDIFGITLDKPSQSSGRVVKNKKQSGHAPNVVAASDTSPAMIDTNEDYTEFFKMAAQHIADTDYHRGISLETLQRFGVGFVSQWEHPTTAKQFPGTYLSPRLIVPNDNGGYLARDTRQNLTVEQGRYQKQHVKPNGLFNGQVLKKSTAPVFVVEGEIDALSIIDAGGEAVALCSTTNASKLIEAVKTQRPKVPLILVPDNDTAGQKGMERLAEDLRRIDFFSYRQYELPSQYKDANAFLMGDKEGFIAWVKAGTVEVIEESTAECEAFERESAAYALNDLLVKIKANKERQLMSTGFSNLDALLDGGLWPGLYTLGAASSAGKTALVLQIADNLAQSGNSVLILSLEMSRLELLARSLSRLTLIKCVEKYGNTTYAKTTHGILRGYFSPVEHELLVAATNEYEKYGQNIYIVEGVLDLGVDVIRKKVEEHIRFKGKAPVVMVDYLQALAAPKVKHSLTDKQITDMNIIELKRVSRDYDTPVLAISSFNRDNYLKPVNMSAFKESGMVEYSSDVAIGLQYYGWDYLESEKGEKDTGRATRLRLLQEKNEKAGRALKKQDMQLKLLKTRNIPRGDCRLDFWAGFNFFREYQGD